MILISNINDFNPQYIILSEKVRNTVIDNCLFTRICYSTPFVTFNSLYIKFDIKNMILEKNFNKYKCKFNLAENKNLLNQIKNLETDILNLYNCNKQKQFSIYEQLEQGYFKVFSNSNKKLDNIVLKISGLWEGTEFYGITSKFLGN
tara:strand:+ start:62 stop:502 length:441 start_codon:yes stop_codon:yes gene_type:complete